LSQSKKEASQKEFIYVSNFVRLCLENTRNFFPGKKVKLQRLNKNSLFAIKTKRQKLG
jgi:hypothetical protein